MQWRHEPRNRKSESPVNQRDTLGLVLIREMATVPGQQIIAGVNGSNSKMQGIAGNVSGHDSLVNIRFGRAQHFASDGENGKGMKQRYTLLTKPLNASSF